MSAIATLLLTFVQPGDCVVHSGPLYAATETLIAKILGQFGVSWVDFPSGATREEIDAAIAKGKEQGPGQRSSISKARPTRPTMLVDVEAVARRARCRVRRRRAAADRDRQYLPRAAVGQAARAGRRPLVYSLTKYVGGHSDLVAGGLVGEKGADQPGPHDAQHDRHDLRPQHRVDAAAQPRNARAADGPRGRECGQGLRLPARAIRRSKRSAISASSRKARARPTFTSRHCTGAGSTFSLYLKGGEKEAFAFLDALQIANLAVSLGGTETLASAPAAMTHLSVPDERKKQLDITPNLVRISIGVEDADDLIADFANALNAV